LPLGVKVTVNRWRQHLDVLITMQPQSDGQDGHCGNLNGDASDDDIMSIKARMDLRVSRSDSLFPTDFYTLQGCYGDGGSSERRDLPVSKGRGLELGECALACRDFEYFGLQWKRECFCGNSYGKYGQLLDKDCKCEAENIGQNRNCVYAFGNQTEPAQKTLADCDSSVKAAGERRCRKKLGHDRTLPHDEVYEACVFDVCFGGDDFA